MDPAYAWSARRLHPLEIYHDNHASFTCQIGTCFLNVSHNVRLFGVGERMVRSSCLLQLKEKDTSLKKIPEKISLNPLEDFFKGRKVSYSKFTHNDSNPEILNEVGIISLRICVLRNAQIIILNSLVLKFPSFENIHWAWMGMSVCGRRPYFC